MSVMRPSSAQSEMPLPEPAEQLYVPGRLLFGGEVEVLGKPFAAADALTATLRARVRWADCGVIPWWAATEHQRATALRMAA